MWLNPVISENLETKSSDLLFVTDNKSIFKRLVGWFTRSRGEKKTKAKHVAAMSTPFSVIEALWTVKESSRHFWTHEHDEFEIWRNVNWTHDEREELAKAMQKRKGNIYGFWKLFLIAGDCMLSKFTPKEVFFFRKVMFSNSFPICSWLYAYEAENVLDYTFDMPSEWTDPDSMRDHCLKSSEWKLIFRKT